MAPPRHDVDGHIEGDRPLPTHAVVAPSPSRQAAAARGRCHAGLWRARHRTHQGSQAACRRWLAAHHHVRVPAKGRQREHNSLGVPTHLHVLPAARH